MGDYRLETFIECHVYIVWIYMYYVSHVSIFYMRYIISNSFHFLRMGHSLRRRGYLRLQAHAWILTGGNKPLVDFRKYYYADSN
jgi:hypothetical protein